MARGGGLIVLGETEQDKYGNNLNELLGAVRAAPRERHRPGLRAPRERAELGARRPAARGARSRRRSARARERGLPVPGDDDLARATARVVLARTHATASVPGAPLIVAATHGAGAGRRARRLGPVRRRLHRRARPPRAVAEPLSTGPRRARRRDLAGAAERDGHGPEHEPAWARLRDETNALALLQAPDGSLLGDADADAARGHVEAMAERDRGARSRASRTTPST